MPFQPPMPSMAASPLPTAGWYCVRAILWAFQFDSPLSVAAHAGAEFSSAGVPISVGATLLFSGGRRGHFQCGGWRAAPSLSARGKILPGTAYSRMMSPHTEAPASIYNPSSAWLRRV